MDDLTYVYDSGNKLMKVSDAATIDQYGFKDDAVNTTADTSDDYLYDLNGNLQSDANKGITEILYNYLNLPTKLTIVNSEHDGNIQYVYAADGTKLKKTVSTGTTTEYANGYVYENSTLQFFNHPEGYVSAENGAYKYVYNYKDYLGNIRLSYTDANGNGIIDPTNEIVKESNYYPFGLEHKGYNGVTSPLGNSVAKKMMFGGKELDESFNGTLNMYDFGARNYDPAIGRWTTMDPVTHWSASPYNAFDNNPVFWADPSGTITVNSIQEAWDATPNGGSSTWNSDGNGGLCDNCPKEGDTKPEYSAAPRGAVYATGGQSYYHSNSSGGGSNAGWYSKKAYNKILDGIALEILKENPSASTMSWLSKLDDGVLDRVLDHVGSVSDKIIGAKEWHDKYMRSGHASPMGFDSPFFLPGLAAKLLSGGGRVSLFAFWSGRGTQQVALNAGYKVLGGTRAGQNLAVLTSTMEYSVGSQAWHFWGRLSQAYARKFTKGSTVNVFVTRGNNANPMSIWRRFERPILEANKVKIKYNFID